MRRALIGYTGFVGGNLLRQTDFDATYRSSDIADIAGEEFDVVVCAGAPGAKWLANQDPGRDRESLRVLTNALAGAAANHFVLISTVDVYPTPIDVDEAAPIDAGALQPYGRNRLALERFVAARFAATIVRLPGLFGPGLKKNVVYDLLHDHQRDRICPASVFQFYDLCCLWADIERARDAGIDVLNLATEPIAVRDLAAVALGLELAAAPDLDPVRYDMKTRHGKTLGVDSDYLYDRATVLAAMRRFVEGEGWVRP